MKVRVRFAPSPTGSLHIGGARTALFNWLYARHTGGTFILRIEDTDAARNSREAVEVILNGLRWLGLDWEEGPISGDATGPSKGDRGPYFQSQRKEDYERRVEALLSRGLAYEHEGAIKFKMRRDPLTIPDLVVGHVTRDLTDRERLDPDFIIVRSDGQPVFHLVNVVDDLEMGITHVIRGEDHLSNTAKHIALFQAFGVAPPCYAHIPLILNPDGTKMAKRDTGASLTHYMETGYAPEAVVNYLCLLGWLAVQALARAGIDTNKYSLDYVKGALDTCKGKVKVFGELGSYAGFYFTEELTYDPEAVKREFIPENQPRVARLREAFAKLTAFDADTIGATLVSTAKELGVKTGVLVHPTRLACTGKTAGPSLYHLIAVLGRERTLRRLDQALARM